MLEPRHLQAISESWPMLQPRLEQITELFYRRLLRRHPEYQLMFPANMTEQREKLVKTLEFVIRHAEHLDDIIGDIVELGSAHADLGIAPIDYPKVGLCLLEAMQEVLGDSFDTPQAEAWGEAYTTLAEVMSAAPPHDPGY